MVKALESGNIGKAKEELNEGISLLTNQQKIIKLADKSEFGWATVQEHVCDDLVDDKLTSPKSKRPRKERQLSSNPSKRRREEPTPNFRLLRLRQAMLPGLKSVAFILSSLC